MNGQQVGLATRVRALVESALSVYTATPYEATVRDLLSRLDEPLRVAVAGKVKAGKSTLLNALVGESLAPTDAGECTRVVTWYRHGLTYKASFERRDGTVLPARFSRDNGSLEVFLDGNELADVRRIDVEWPTSTLQMMTLIDTPGIGSLTEEAGERTREFLSPSEEVHTPADAVLYLMRHMHHSDARFLESFHDDEAAKATPVNAIAVLSRADEIGGGQADSMRAAKRIAVRYRTDESVRRLCQTVVPVAGLLAQLGGTLTEQEFRSVAKLAALADDESDSLLVSADRFTRSASALALAPEEREYLIRRFGLYGLRLANALVRAGKATSARQLAEALRMRSGLDDLRRELTTHFAMRRDVLKARSTLLALGELTRRTSGNPGVAEVSEAVERVLAGAHELAELRLFTAVRSGAVQLDEDEAVEVERFATTMGSGPSERLALPADTPVRQLRAAALKAHSLWAVRAENPITPVAVVEAARIMQRSYESLIMELTEQAAVVG